MSGGAIRRGLVAGATGTTVLNAVTYLDMAVRGRSGSSVPDQTVQAAAARFDVTIPGSRSVRANRSTALGALAGIGSGLGVGVAASLTRAAGVRLPAPLGMAATTAAAMAATDASAAALGVTDPRTWSSADWASDVAPHLAYGVATSAVLRWSERDSRRHRRRRAHSRTDPSTRSRTAEPHRPSVGLVLRSLALGAATGSRSSLGSAAVMFTGGRSDAPSRGLAGRAGTAASAVALGAEIAADKHPAMPSRLDAPAFGLRLLSGSGGAVALARRDNARAKVPAVAGAVGAVAGAWAGAAWRSGSAGKVPARQAALAEDAVALLLAGAACVPGRRKRTA